MHSVLATLFALLSALCHHTSLTARPVEAAELRPAAQAFSSQTASSMILPDRYQLARYSSDSSYAEASCSSCRRTDGISIER